MNDRANGSIYAIWGGSVNAGTPLTLAPNTAAIFLENSGNNFDASDYGGNTNITGISGFNPNSNNCSTGPIAALAQCVNNSPIVTFTVDSTATDLVDAAHVLDTGGFDSAGYVHHHSNGTDSLNESLQWRLIGTTGINDPGGNSNVPEPGSMMLTGLALAGLMFARRRAK